MKINAKCKLIFILCSTTLAVILQKPIWLAVLFAIVVLMCLLSQINWVKTVKSIWLLVIAILFMSIMQSVFTKKGEIIFTFFALKITDYGLNMAVNFFIRMLVLIFSASIVATSTMSEMADALVGFKIPYKMAFMTVIAVKFLPLFRQEFKDRKIALKLRLQGNKITCFKKFYALIYLLTPTVSGCIIKSKQVAMSLESRAFGLYNKRVSIACKKLNFGEWLLNILFLSLTILTIVLYYI
ncbi:MAG: energy-coupling factor transporter transmembrane component T [Clostridia bacterium]